MSTTTTDLAAWLLEQIAEDERIARAAAEAEHNTAGSGWQIVGESWTLVDGEINRTNDLEPWSDGDGYFSLGLPDQILEHMTAWDPARVLAECDAKRKLLDPIRLELLDDVTNETAQGMLRWLALPYADRAGYREEWRP